MNGTPLTCEEFVDFWIFACTRGTITRAATTSVAMHGLRINLASSSRPPHTLHPFRALLRPLNRLPATTKP